MVCTIVQLGVYTRKSPASLSNIRLCNRFEIEYMLSATGGQSFLDKRNYPLSAGTLIFRKPGQTSQSLPHFKCYYIHFNVKKNSPYYEELMQLPDYYSLINPQTYREILEKIIHHTIKNPENLQDDFAAAKMLELIYHLKKDAANNQSVSNNNRQNQMCLQKTLTHIKAHFNENLTLKDLGEFAGYTPNYFARLFINTMKTTPQKYIEQLRIEHAKYLLVKDDLSIAEIAYACGFSTQSYFALVFKKYTFISPFEFRKNAILLGNAIYQQTNTPPLKNRKRY